jgi:hypothetical protein
MVFHESAAPYLFQQIVNPFKLVKLCAVITLTEVLSNTQSKIIDQTSKGIFIRLVSTTRAMKPVILY